MGKVTDVSHVKKVAQKFMKKMYGGSVAEVVPYSSTFAGQTWIAYVKVSFTDKPEGYWKLVISSQKGNVIHFEPVQY